MANPEIDPENEDSLDLADLDDASAKRRKILLIALGALAVLLFGGGLGYYFLMMRGSGHEEEAIKAKNAEGIVYVDVPEMNVNLRTQDGQTAFLKINFSIAARDEAAGEDIKEQLPAIRDAMQPFLRELRPEDLAGSAAVFRIKEEMTRRAIARVGPDMIEDIMIEDLIQQ